jgi:toxin CptA
MPAHGSRAPLVLRPGFSRRLAVFLGLSHAAALLAVLGLPIAWYWRAGFGAAVLASLARQSALHLLHRAPSAVREAVWAAEGAWTITLGSGRTVDASLLRSTFVSTSLVVLNFRCGRWRRHALVLLPDNLEANLLRRLRVRLRIAGGHGDGAAQAGA